MARRGRKVSGIVDALGQIGHKNLRKRSVPVNGIVFFLGCPGIVKEKIRECRRRVAGHAIPDFAVLNRVCRQRTGAAFGEENFQPGQFVAAKLERLGLSLKCAIRIRHVLRIGID